MVLCQFTLSIYVYIYVIIFRIADYSIIVAKNTLALNFPTKVVLETVDILKRYGLSGFAGLLLRQDFLESVETLKRISGMVSALAFVY